MGQWTLLFTLYCGSMVLSEAGWEVGGWGQILTSSVGGVSPYHAWTLMAVSTWEGPSASPEPPSAGVPTLSRVGTLKCLVRIAWTCLCVCVCVCVCVYILGEGPGLGKKRQLWELYQQAVVRALPHSSGRDEPSERGNCDVEDMREISPGQCKGPGVGVGLMCTSSSVATETIWTYIFQ